MRIAIVGAGISGLVAAHLLRRTHDVTVFEAAGDPGGHARTVRVDTSDATHHLDTGFIVFNERNYPNFSRLLRQLGVPSQPSTMTFSVHDSAGTFEYSSRIPHGLYASASHLLRPSFQRMVADYIRFRRAAHHFLADTPRGDARAMASFIAESRFSHVFVDRLLVPLGASIWSADRSRFLQFPARYVLAFFLNHGLITTRGRPRWRTVSGGSSTYVDAITSPLGSRLRVGTPVQAIERGDDHVRVRLGGGHEEEFERVVLAVHSDQALAMLADASAHERRLLEAFPYQRNEVVLHSDVSLLPRRRRVWSAWNYHLFEDPQQPTSVTYHLNQLQSLHDDRQFCITTNPDERIDERLVIRRMLYEHPLFTAESERAQGELQTLNGRRGTYFCGAYWGTGFHEDGVNSALAVCALMGERL